MVRGYRPPLYTILKLASYTYAGLRCTIPNGKQIHAGNVTEGDGASRVARAHKQTNGWSHLTE